MKLQRKIKIKNGFTIDRDEFPDISEEQNVMGIPSLLVFKNGEKLAHLHSANAKTADAVKEFLNNVVKRISGAGSEELAR